MSLPQSVKGLVSQSKNAERKDQHLQLQEMAETEMHELVTLKMRNIGIPLHEWEGPLPTEQCMSKENHQVK